MAVPVGAAGLAGRYLSASDAATYCKITTYIDQAVPFDAPARPLLLGVIFVEGAKTLGQSEKRSLLNGYWRKNHRNRPRNDELGCGRDGRQGGEGHPQCRGESSDAERRRVHRQGRNGRRRTGPAASGDQPHPHRLLDQAFHGPSPQRSGHGREDCALQGGRRTGRLRQGPCRQSRLHPAGNLRLTPCGNSKRRPRPTWATRSTRP